MKPLHFSILFALFLHGAALGGEPRSKPYGGQPQMIPGRIEVERYDLGGEGVAYHDADETNNGSGKLNLKFSQPEAGFRRDEAVDISFTKPPRDKFKGDLTIDGELEPAGALYLGWVRPGEWTRYTIDVKKAGVYQIGRHVSAGRRNSGFEISFSGNNARHTVRIPHTGGAHRWTTVANLGEITLAAGRQVMTLRIGPVTGFNVDWLDFKPAEK